MDDFEKAILFSFDQTGAVDAQLKAQAQAYCDQAKQSPTIWRVCLERFAVSQFAEVQFWCLQILEEVVKQQYVSLSQEDRLLLRQTLTSAILSYEGTSPRTGGSAPAAFCGQDKVELAGGSIVSSGKQGQQQCRNYQPVFVRNKMAQIVVLLVYIEYPSAWPSVFLDIVKALEQGPHIVDIFCRILNTLDEEVISLDYPRTPVENSVAMRIKDAMRQQCIAQIVDAWYQLVVGYESINPAISTAVLETMQRFISWIDINLVANDRWIPLFFKFLSCPQDLPRLKGAAADCLLAVITKRMEVKAKVALLQQLQMGQVCRGLMEVQEPEFALKVTSLLTGLATELLECCKKVDLNGANLDAETIAAADIARSMLDDVLPAVLYFMEHGDQEMAVTTLQFLLAYAAKIKKGSQLSAKQREHLAQILAVVRSRMRYHLEYEESLNEPDKEGLEEEERMSEYRRDLFTLLKNIARVAPDVAKAFVQSSLLAAIRKPDTSFADMEAALALLYQLGEGVTEEALKSMTGPMAEMAATILSSNIPHHGHRVIALMYLEIVVRYVRFIQQHAEYIPAALAAFLGDKGTRHPNVNVSSRASYLLMRLVKTLRVQLVPYLDSILQSLQHNLAAIATTSPVMKMVAIGRVDGPIDERIYAFEAVGLLIGLEELPKEKMSEYLSALLVPLCRQVDLILANDVPPGDPVGPQSAVFSLQQVILAISYLSKGFGEQLTTGSRPEIGALFKQALDMVLRVLQALPKNKTLRTRVISFLHRMVETLGSSVFPFLPTAIQQLLLECEVKDMVEFVQLVNQLLNKFKSGMLPILTQVLSPLISRIFALLPATTVPQGPGSNTEEVREQQELQRNYIAFLQAVASNDLSDVFLAPQNSPCLTQVIGSLHEICSSHPDTILRRGALAVWVKFIADWCAPANEPEKVPGFRQFVVEHFFPECCILAVLRPNFDLRDANTYALFGDLAQAQKMILQKCGSDFLLHLATVVLPSVHCPPNLAEEYCFHLQRSTPKELKAFLKPLMEQLRPLQNGNTALFRRPYG